VRKAFVLGAGIGERLRPLTDQLPKPLVPVFHRPLITYAFDHLISAGIQELIVNTHHLPEAYARAFPQPDYRGLPLHFRNESPVRLETAGGIANVRDLLGAEPFIVYNGDILTDLPLEKLMRTHRAQGNMVTLALRSSGPALHIEMDAVSGRLTDIRNRLGTGGEGRYLFTGIYACEPEFHRWLTPGKVESVIPVFLRMIQEGAALGGVIIDEGHWWDLGSRASYLEAHRTLAALGRHFPSYALPNGCREPVAPTARIAPDAAMAGVNVIGATAVVGAGASLEDCVIWPGGVVAPGARLRQCIIRSAEVAAGEAVGADF
jgi:mannose-1-phosphate guanylyltransferase/mannose-1-phosphate guanylyltransferase/phosphomannomutase